MGTPIAMYIGKWDSRAVAGAVHGFFQADVRGFDCLRLVDILTNQNAIIKSKVFSKKRSGTSSAEQRDDHASIRKGIAELFELELAFATTSSLQMKSRFIFFQEIYALSLSY